MALDPDPKVYEHVYQNGKWLYLCRLCRDRRPREPHNLPAHELSRAHQHMLSLELTRTPSPEPITDAEIVEDTFRELLRSMSSQPGHSLRPDWERPCYDEPNFPSTSSTMPSPCTGINWGLYEATQNTQAEFSAEDQMRMSYARQAIDILDSDTSDCGGYGRPSSDEEGNVAEEDPFSDDESEGGPHKRARNHKTDADTARNWYLWSDRMTCALDIIMHLPRSAFSRKQLDLFLWLLRVNGLDYVPSGKSMKAMNEALQEMCGIDTLEYNGKMGHRYHVNSLPQILAQEMSNPMVRPFLHFYPEDTGKYLSETRQGETWLHRMCEDDATPMVRIADEDYYTFEPTMLANGTCCIPHRWFTRNGLFYAQAWALKPTVNGWVVIKGEEVEVCQDHLAKNFPRLLDVHQKYGLPHPSKITVQPKGPCDFGLISWSHTNPAVGNRWRVQAQGHRVLAMPIWLYCDDTSGNASKKWNEHNSFLFTLAGLPREQISKEYNVHFLCTSNIAPPLEMMDGVVEQIQNVLKDGVWAWDMVNKEPVLLLGSALALLGDNPMHSEFCCHIGLRGKFLCRVCWVKGTDAQDGANIIPICPEGTPGSSPAPSEHAGSDNGSVAGSDDSSAHKPGPVPKKKGKYTETMEAMFNRIMAFITPGKLRYKAETQKTLALFFEQAQKVGEKTRLKLARTETGIKDTMQEFFFDKLFASYQHTHGYAAKQEVLDLAVQRLPEEITSPVWRLNLDPHQDTPVEILHVVLLGFVKYFWQDVIQNRTNDDQKKILITRLNSIKVDGLGITRLKGETLVKYAGSLTGRDFRAISQVAPFVIYDLVPQEVYDAWLALSTLVPLIYQPTINDIDEFVVTLEAAIQNFLAKTAQWTTAWFNKSKFHILLHLPDHIRRFGPAILFATEAFELFNAVIRTKSIHSNRQAPSRDIALAFAQANRIRHLLSGGYFLPAELVPRWKENPDSIHPSKWRTIGRGPTKLMEEDFTPSSYLGLNPVPKSHAGQMKKDKQQPRLWNQTMTGQKLPYIFDRAPRDALYTTGAEVRLDNNDCCPLGQYVLVKDHHNIQNSCLFIARVCEILQKTNSSASQMGEADGLLLQTAKHTHPVLPSRRSFVQNSSGDL